MKSFLKYSALITVVLFLGSCEDWLDVNDDPNNPTGVAPNFVLPAAQASIAGVVGGDFSIIGGLWSQHWTQAHVSSQYKTRDAYDLIAADYNVAWTELYAGGLNDFEDVKVKAAEIENNNMVLQAVVGQTYGYQMLADWFDKIPLSEALQVSTIQSPVYDNGPAIYTELIKRLNDALALNFNNGLSTQISSDLVFGDLDAATQIDQWKRFANTLKLKLYLRQTESSNAAQAISAIETMLDAGTAFLTTDAGITQFVDEPNRSNPLYENNIRQLNVATNLRLSKTLQSYLEANSDLGRLDAYFTAGSAGTQFGLAQGDFNANTTTVPPNVPSVAIIKPLDAFYFFSLDEVYFMLAEAYLRTGDVISAKSYYDLGVEEAYAKFSVPFPAAKIGLGGVYEFPLVGTTDQQLEAIMMQKWVAMFKQGYESFWDQARTGYPRNSPVPVTSGAYVPGQWTMSVNAVTTAFPKRILYTSASSDVNPNTPDAKVTDKVWWMK